MFKTPEQFASANKAAVDSMLTLANTALASAERIATLNQEPRVPRASTTTTSDAGSSASATTAGRSMVTDPRAGTDTATSFDPHTVPSNRNRRHVSEPSHGTSVSLPSEATSRPPRGWTDTTRGANAFCRAK